MESDKKFMNQNEYAIYRGIAPQAVAKAIRLGRITSVETLEDGGKRIDVEKADIEWNQNTDFANVRKNGDSVIDEVGNASIEGEKEAVPQTYAQSRAMREALNAKLTQLEYDKKAGKLIEVDRVRAEWFNLARTVRNAILGVPDRIAPLLAAETNPDKLHAALTEELTKTLETLANAKF